VIRRPTGAVAAATPSNASGRAFDGSRVLRDAGEGADMEKRRARRHARRLKVRYGEEGKGFHHIGLTSDVSATGMFVLANSSPKPGTRVHLEVTLPGEVQLFVEAVVARQVLVPPELRQVVKSGFGVRFLTGTELMAELVPPPRQPAKKGDPFALALDDPATWKAAWEREYSRGGATAALGATLHGRGARLSARRTRESRPAARAHQLSPAR
jgi:hypothetical protein